MCRCRRELVMQGAASAQEESMTGARSRRREVLVLQFRRAIVVSLIEQCVHDGLMRRKTHITKLA
jgi:hypothetical protein